MKIPIAFLSSAPFISSTAVARATWLNLACYCDHHMLNGRIIGAALWSDRYLTFQCGVTHEEIAESSPLVTIDGDDFVVLTCENY